MIYETIISSIDAEGNVHVTPFGIRMQQGLVVISPFKPSSTLDNILATEHAVLNLTDDVRNFAGALTGREVGELVPTEKIAGFRLSDVLVHKELKLVKVQDDAVRPQLFLEVVHEEQHEPFQGFNRAQAAVIELAVLVSRLKRLPMEKINQEIAYLSIAIEKTAGSRELEAWGWLMEAVTNHQAAMNAENLA
ncbi:MAG: tetrahydromethanopterin synthesis protein [Methylotenera sp. RIFCSPLOWO2_02_FULL_45_14]|nr:MAG: tetrahydromethanopterin synthesis protein [Methylotenera sp. RIFCSPLOWO2_02_FULL_45_14]